MQEWYLGWEKVSCLERNTHTMCTVYETSLLVRCPQFRGVLIEREVSSFQCCPYRGVHCIVIFVYCLYETLSLSLQE